MFTHNLDPILIDFGFIAIRWYSLAYIFGIILGWWYGKKIIIKYFNSETVEINLKNFDDLITNLIFSIIIGGRLGYVIFYNPKYYISNPLDIIKIWEGGMSFHGALIGVIIGTYFFSKKRNIQPFFLLDIVSCVAPIGIFFGRVANFINGELVGKTSNIFWGVIFPDYDSLVRHPSQLYEAVLEGLVLFFIMNSIIKRINYQFGTCSYLFLIYYGFFRILSEFFREPDEQLGLFFNLISMGTLLSVCMIISGFVLFKILRKNEN